MSTSVGGSSSTGVGSAEVGVGVGTGDPDPLGGRLALTNFLSSLHRTMIRKVSVGTEVQSQHEVTRVRSDSQDEGEDHVELSLPCQLGRGGRL